MAGLLCTNNGRIDVQPLPNAKVMIEMQGGRLNAGTAYLRRDFRNLVFCRAYEKAGSLRGIAAELGYTLKPGVNGVVRDMWKGTKGMPLARLQALAKFVRVSDEEVRSNLISKENNQLLEDWATAVFDYRKNATRS